MKRERLSDEFDRADERPRSRAARVALRVADQPAEPEETETAVALEPAALPDALLALCQRFGLEPWAGARDDRGVWAFGRALAQWLARPPAEQRTETEAAAETVRLVTNLLIVVGAVTRPPQRAAPGACGQAMAAVGAARRAVASYDGPVASFPAAARAMQRLVRVRGWMRLTQPQQLLAEAMLGLYLESLAALAAAPRAGVLLTLSEAWLSVLQTLALPAGFDERILRATSWYLETYLSSAALPQSPALSSSRLTRIFDKGRKGG
jgi:hypothetical protein